MVTTTSTDRQRLTLHIGYDQDAENPADTAGWKPYSFCTRHCNFTEPEQLGLKLERDVDGTPKMLAKLRRKMEVGLAFFLSYFQHGDCLWFLKGSKSPPDMRWDGNVFAGLLVWELPVRYLGSKTYEERWKDAAWFLETYTAYCNGHVYYLSLHDADGQQVDGAVTVYDVAGDFEAALEEFKDHLVGQQVEVTGAAKWLLDCHKPQWLEIRHGK
jgi:hypothetical protein